MNLFQHNPKTTIRPTPLPGASVSDNPAPQPVNGSDGASYNYHTIGKLSGGDHKEAQRIFSEGTQAQASHELPRAVEAYRKATQLDPLYFEAYYNLGLAAGEVGDLDGALLAYEKALAVQPESVDARYNFALLLKQANYFRDAASELEKLISLSPKEGRAHLALGNLYAQQLKDIPKARLHYLKVLEVDPRNPQGDAIRYWIADHPAR
jgi:tetratricopeptide (TPR) repeat protein